DRVPPPRHGGGGGGARRPPPAAPTSLTFLTTRPDRSPCVLSSPVSSTATVTLRPMTVCPPLAAVSSGSVFTRAVPVNPLPGSSSIFSVRLLYNARTLGRREICSSCALVAVTETTGRT